MYLARALPDALALALLSMCCWGSWSNTLVYLGDRLRFELYYTNYAIGVFLTSLLFAATLGMVQVSGCSEAVWYPDDWGVARHQRFLALAAGVVFNVANILLVKGIQMCGLAVAFPLGIGTALVLGTVLTHFTESSKGGNAALLFAGVAVAFLAVCTASLTHRLKDASSKGCAKDADGNGSSDGSDSDGQGTESGSSEAASAAAEPSPARKLLICVGGGTLMSLWSPLNARAQDGFGGSSHAGLSPYGAFFAFSFGVMLSTLLLIPLVLACPLDDGEPVSVKTALREHRRAPLKAHLYGLAGGAVWALGTLANSISGERLSYAASYAIGQSAPMVAMCWGVFHFHEFDGAPMAVKALLVLVAVLFIASIALIALSH